MKVTPYADDDAREWDALVAQAPMATFLHTRSYLSYHANRFQDVSVCIRDDNRKLLGLFPAAIDTEHSSHVVSHPGITYGGLVYQAKLRGERMLEALSAVRDFYAQKGFDLLTYKAVPYIYHSVPASDDIYGLFRLGAIRYRCDLSSAIDLQNRQPVSERRRRGLKKALKAGLQIVTGADYIEPLWEVLKENLERKHNVKPVHTAVEIRFLHSMFPENIDFVVALDGSQVVGGIVLFTSSTVAHSQYSASSRRGYEVSALDAVFEYCLEQARQRVRYFSLGVSTEQNGCRLNSDLYQFKTEFGGGGIVHDFYQLELHR
jgi:hypothetical protein